MAEPASRPVPPPKRGPIGKLVNAVLAFAFWLFLGMVGNVLFEWVCMKTVWPEEGPTHSVAMVEAELAYLDRDFSEGVFIRHPALFARDLAEAVNAKVYKDWRLEAKALDLERRAALARLVGEIDQLAPLPSRPGHRPTQASARLLPWQYRLC